MTGPLTSLSVSKNPPGLSLTWADNFKTILSYETLRRECPCAPCQSARKAFDPQSLSLPSFKPTPEGALDLKKIEPVGHYAITLVWGDGHATGIYPYDYLRQLSEIKNSEASFQV